MDTQLDVIKNMILLNREATDSLLKRYDILRCISFLQPIGRRQLAMHTGYTEREVRSETDNLRMTGLISTDTAGMFVTYSGQNILNNLQSTMLMLGNTDSLEDALKKKYSLKDVSIVSGDSDRHMLIKREMGILASVKVRDYFYPGKKIVLTGHKCVKYMVDAQYPTGAGKNVLLLPARTAQFNDEDISANSNCAALGKKCGADYKLLHLGKNPTINEIENRYSDDDVKEIVDGIMCADLFVSGITPINESQQFASMSVRAKDVLLQQEPCCELLGNFIKADGRQINNTPLYSLRVDQISCFPCFMLISSGKNELNGIRALVSRFQNIHLITDEATAIQLNK